MTAAASADAIEAAFAGVVGGFRLDARFSAPMRGITALFGPSGSGKTTILRAVAGLAQLSGRLTVAGGVWQDDAAGVFVPTHRRPIGYVFQEASLFPHLSVRKNLEFGRRRAVAPDAAGSGLDPAEVIALLGLAPLLDRAPGALSGGERQRVAIGRALLSRPRLLLMDEPLSALDRSARDGILPYLEALHETLVLPILYVSHDLDEVARLADRMVLIEAGRVAAEGPVEAMVERLDFRPSAGGFEAGVVLHARVRAHDTLYRLTRLDCHGREVAVPLIDRAVGEDVRLRIRARDVALATRRPEGLSIRNILPGHVAEIAVAPDTAFAEVIVDIGGGRLRARITREALADLGLAVGTPVFALVKSISFDRGPRLGRRDATGPPGGAGGPSGAGHEH